MRVFTTLVTLLFAATSFAAEPACPPNPNWSCRGPLGPRHVLADIAAASVQGFVALGRRVASTSGHQHRHDICGFLHRIGSSAVPMRSMQFFDPSNC